MMSNHLAEKPRFIKRQKKETKRQKKETTSPSSCGLLSLPYELAMNCFYRLSRVELSDLSQVSKSHRSLVVSHDLYFTRSLMNCTEEFWYVCLRCRPDPTPRWHILSRRERTLEEIAARKTLNWRLSRPIPSYHYQPHESSSFVAIGYSIYVIGGIIKGSPTSQVLLLDCLSHTWRRVRAMKVARSSAAANVVDGKIYVFGGCGEETDPSSYGEVFDPKTQTWDTLPVPEDPELRKNTRKLEKSFVIEDRIYVVDEEDRSFYYLPKEGIWSRGKQDSKLWKQDFKREHINHWCAIGKLLYCSTNKGKIMWCEPDDLEWKEVKGLGRLDWGRFARRANNNADEFLYLAKLYFFTEIGFCRLTSNSRGNILVFWTVCLPPPFPNQPRMDLWCAEISLERHEGGEIWGKIKWGDEVSELDPLFYGVDVLYSAFVSV